MSIKSLRALDTIRILASRTIDWCDGGASRADVPTCRTYLLK